jgi:hypothetical protein
MGDVKKKGPPQRKPGNRTRFSDGNIAKALDKCLGNIARAAEVVGCSRRTIEVRMRENEDLRELVRGHLEDTKDYAEAKIKEKMLNGDTTMLIFFAKTKMKDRGYIERVEQDVVFQGQMTTQQQAPTLDLTKLSQEELLALDKLLSKAGQPSLLS